MKKLLALLLSVVMVLSLAACGAKGDTEKEKQTDMEYVKEKGNYSYTKYSSVKKAKIK